ncbi:MAG TPA: tetratricopeptide repeat protein [Myxococcota bacterium]|nr:tetratricopeptide repeat protein [Myxococcota bacterium]
MMRPLHLTVALSLAALVACKKKPPEPVVEESPTTVEAVPNAEAGDVTAEEMGSEAWGDPVETTPAVASLSPEQQRRDSVNQAVASLTNPSMAPGAAATLRQVVREDPANAYAQYNLGLAYELQGSSLEARKAYLAAIQADPTLGAAYVNLGGLDMKATRYGSAEAQYRMGLRNDPENMDLWSGLISSLRAQGRLTDAEREAKAALKVNTNALDVYANLGLVYIELGRLDLANFIVQKGVLQGGSEHAALHQIQGRIYQLQDKTGDAKASFEKALELDSDLVATRLWLSDYLLDNRNYEDTVELLERARELEPENPAIHLNLGIAYRGVERYEEAIESYQAVTRLEPGNPDPHLNLGILYGDYIKNYDSAVTEYETYRSMGGTQAELMDGYIEKTRKEQEKVRKLEDRKRRLEEKQKEKDANEAALKALEEKKAAEEAAQPDPPPPEETPEPEAPAPEVPEEAPAEEQPSDDPWGG